MYWTSPTSIGPSHLSTAKGTNPMLAAEAQARANKAGNNHAAAIIATVFPQREAAEAQRRYLVFANELKPTGEVGMALVLRAATMSARMERCTEYETAMLTDRVRRAQADFVPPEGVDDAQAAQLRAEAGKRALFDPSKEAAMARKFEDAAERSFLRAIKELQRHEKMMAAAEDEEIEEKLASSFSREEAAEGLDFLDDLAMDLPPRKGPDRPGSAHLATPRGRSDVPFSVGKRR